MKHIESIVKTSGIIKADPSDSLSTVLSHLSSSHDAAFVFDKKNFVGVVNPYYCLIRSSNPGTTKVEHCLFHPPRIHYQDSMERIANLMMETKIHYLPLFNDKDEFVGITSARRILKLMYSQPIAETKIEDVLNDKNGGVVLIYNTETVGHAISLFKKYKISKLMMIDANMKLQGILSYYDLIPYMVAPGISKQKGRGRKNNEDKEKMNKMKVKNYAKTTILTLRQTDRILDAINLILMHKIGSIAIVDSQSHPTGIVTTKDILNLLMPRKKAKEVELTAKRISPEHEKAVNDLLKFVKQHIERNDHFSKAHILIEEEKNGGLYNVHLSLTPSKGKIEMIKREGKDLKTLIKDIRNSLKVVEKK